MGQEENKFDEIVSKCWADDSFKERFIEDPKSVLAEHGIDVPAEIKVTVVQNTNDHIYVMLPPAPIPEGGISDAELAAVAGGAAGSFSFSSATVRRLTSKLFTPATQTSGKECVPW